MGVKDATSGRWAVKTGTTSLSVKEANFEPIGEYSMKRLATMFAEKALAYQYYDPRKNDYVFDRAYALAVSEGRGIVVDFFLDLFDNEPRFDLIYGRMANN